jgi:hypothetical protein
MPFVWFLPHRVFLSSRIDFYSWILVNLHLLWRNGLVATPLSGLAASLTHSYSLLRTANKEAALIHSRKIAKDAKPFALSHYMRRNVSGFKSCWILSCLCHIPEEEYGLKSLEGSVDCNRQQMDIPLKFVPSKQTSSYGLAVDTAVTLSTFTARLRFI